MTIRMKLGNYAFNEGYAASLDYRGEVPNYGNASDTTQWLLGRVARLEAALDNQKPRPLDELLTEEEAEAEGAMIVYQEEQSERLAFGC